jgi:tRNA (cytidine/uridine-2'-O-)-methyltransferase
MPCHSKDQFMFHLVLYQPEIPPNTGNIIRLCANTGCTLHLVKPLGFDIDDRQLRRAGLDYHEQAVMVVHESWQACQAALANTRWFALTTKAHTNFFEAAFEPGDVFVLGPETRGLPPEILKQFTEAQRLRLPMMPDSRSLNLSNSAAVVIFEAWRQNGFQGVSAPGN